SDAIQPKTAIAPNADRERTPYYRQQNRCDARKGRLLASARHHVEQHQNRSRVLQNDRRGHIRLLNGEIIEIVRSGDSQHTQQNHLAEIDGWELKVFPSALDDQKDEQSEE